MDIDEIYGYVVEPFTGNINFVDKFQYLNQLDFSDYTKQIQEMIYNEQEIESLINQKYKKYKEKEIQSPAGSGNDIEAIKELYKNWNSKNQHFNNRMLISPAILPSPQNPTKKFAFRR